MCEVQVTQANQPDTAPHDNTDRTCLQTDMAVADDSNVSTKETEILSEHKDLEIEDIGLWKVRTKIPPVVIGALGTIKTALDQNLQSLQGHRLAIVLQKVTLMSTAHRIQ